MSAKTLTLRLCIAVKPGATDARHHRCALSPGKGDSTMLMFERSQLYIGLGLAALAQIAFVAKFIIR